MTVIDDGEKIVDTADSSGANPAKSQDGGEESRKEDLFSQENIASDTKVPKDETVAGSQLGIRAEQKDIVITMDDKIAFVDSVVNNSRFERDYVLFGGKMSITVRSLTADEVNAIAAWSLKMSVLDPSWHMSGRGRKYVLAAQVSRVNGVDMPPLEFPLFETLESDGKTVKKPGWVDRQCFWDDKGSGVVDAVIGCIKDFDLRYTTLCSKAEDENFWAPDTH